MVLVIVSVTLCAIVFIYLLIDGRRKKHGPVYRLLRICNRPNERRGIMTLMAQ